MPGKNIRQLGGRPALAYTVTAALESGLFARVVVSTDAAAIAEVARSAGAEVPYVRDAALADDATPVSDVTLDAVRRLDPGGRRFADVAQLMPNCPLRTADDVRASYEQFCRTEAPAQLSVARYGFQNPWWAMRRSAGFALQPLFAEQVTAPSQDLPELFCATGAVWWTRTASLRQSGTFHVAGRTGWELPWPRAIDIDTEDDWLLAELLLQHSGASEAAHAR